MTVKTYTELLSDINTLFASQGAGDISPTTFKDFLTNLVQSTLGITGLGSYVDSVAVDVGTAITIPANTPTVLPCNALTVYDSQKPLDINAFYTPASLQYDALTEDFIVGEVVTGGTSGATATIQECFNSTDGTLYLSAITGTFTDNETITGTSQGSATANGSNGEGRVVGRNGDGFDAQVYFFAVPSAANQTIDINIDIDGTINELYEETKSFPKGSGVARGINYSLASAYQRDTFQKNGGKVVVSSASAFDVYDINFNFDRDHKAR